MERQYRVWQCDKTRCVNGEVAVITSDASLYEALVPEDRQCLSRDELELYWKELLVVSQKCSDSD